MAEFLPFPRMLFKGDATCVVQSADEMRAARLQGWEARPLPGEILEPLASGDDDPPAAVENDPPKRRGRPPKHAQE